MKKIDLLNKITGEFLSYIVRRDGMVFAVKPDTDETWHHPRERESYVIGSTEGGNFRNNVPGLFSREMIEGYGLIIRTKGRTYAIRYLKIESVGDLEEEIFFD